jgi:hypothetical protein
MDHGMVIFNVCINFYNFMSLIIHGKIKVQKAMFSQVKGKVLNRVPCALITQISIMTSFLLYSVYS